ncbi:MAG: hypothetical protein J7545_03055 [Roseofilum sp. SBFL]|uniref:hypothetical protein n=1 Tax=unclassified Roseofilum TaxID=2620099 RepID=UPI001B1E1B80|nr:MULTISPECIES: hypothetical protein [unclassified Roseofilum]MBP0013681.1 hypothetical protein [Roseofilum sp. SID3]MBP0023479.1 hypothetical protein [Roseofilum sp. SID2]MBP0028563.1 hypothetical protein [Roseofilum sp. Guam]MBP0037213.1 hypothetical protein [Roseofilum sp. SID1]MBP0040944.1 hypothetical protein [Roseofilum sp. SBFL]
MSTTPSIINGSFSWSSKTISDPVIEIYYQYSNKLLIADSNGCLYTSYFWLKNLLPIPIVLDSVQITTGETPTEPIVDTEILVPSTTNWADFIEFTNLGNISPGSWSRRYQFTMKIVRAIEGPPLPDNYTNNVYFYPKYTVDYKNLPTFTFDTQVVKA